MQWPPCPFVEVSARARQGAQEGKTDPIQPHNFEECKQNPIFSRYLVSDWHFGTSLEHLEAINKAHREVAGYELQCTYSTAASKFPCFVSWKCNQLRILDFSHPGNSKLLPQTSWLETFQWNCTFSCLGYFHSQSTVLSDGDVCTLCVVVITHGTNYRYPFLYGIQMGYPGTLRLPGSLCRKDLFP